MDNEKASMLGNTCSKFKENGEGSWHRNPKSPLTTRGNCTQKLLFDPFPDLHRQRHEPFYWRRLDIAAEEPVEEVILLMVLQTASA